MAESAQRKRQFLRDKNSSKKLEQMNCTLRLIFLRSVPCFWGGFVTGLGSVRSMGACAVCVLVCVLECAFVAVADGADLTAPPPPPNRSTSGWSRSISSSLSESDNSIAFAPGSLPFFAAARAGFDGDGSVKSTSAELSLLFSLALFCGVAERFMCVLAVLTGAVSISTSASVCAASLAFLTIGPLDVWDSEFCFECVCARLATPETDESTFARVFPFKCSCNRVWPHVACQQNQNMSGNAPTPFLQARACHLRLCLDACVLRQRNTCVLCCFLFFRVHTAIYSGHVITHTLKASDSIVDTNSAHTSTMKQRSWKVACFDSICEF